MLPRISGIARHVAPFTFVYPLHRSLFRSYATLPPHFQPYQISNDQWNQIQDLVEDVRKRNPLALEILNRIDIEGMSTGSISPLTSAHISQAVMALGGVKTPEELRKKYHETEHLLTSNCGEGGDISGHLVKQIASARFSVDIDYVTQAAVLQFKAAQGVKPGVGGALAGVKVNELIAWLRRCEPWTDLYSPGPHADQYSIEDLRLLLRGYLLANPHAIASIKLASEPGVDTIALGSLKAMGRSEQGKRNNIVITGKGSTGNTPLFTKYHTTFPWLVGLSRTHAKLVAAGLRNEVTLTASGGFTGSFFSPFLWGADRVGIATMVLIGDGCIMVRQCHNNTCPVGVATQDPKLIAKNTGSPVDIARVLLSAAELTAIEMQPYFEHVNEAVGRAADVLEPIKNGPLTGHEKYLDLLKIKPRYVSVAPLPSQPGPDEKESHIIEALQTKRNTTFHIDAENNQIGLGARLSALTRTDSAIREIAENQEIKLDITGFTGQNLAILGATGVTFDAGTVHTNDSTGKSLSGASVFANTCGNQAGFAMTEGLIATRGVGSRGAVRKSGGTFLTEYAGSFFANFHTRGTTIILGNPGHYQSLNMDVDYEPPFAFKKNALGFGFLSGFSGGKIIMPRLLWQEALDLNHVSPTIRDEVIVQPLDENDANELIATLEKSVSHLSSPLQKKLLEEIRQSPEQLTRWFIKLNPPKAKSPDMKAGQIALAEEKLAPPVPRDIPATAPAPLNYQKNNDVIPPDRERAACGTSLIMQLDHVASREIVQRAIGALERSEHRGASGADPLTGDGCGLMLFFGAGFFEQQPEFKDLHLKHGRFAIMAIFMPKDPSARAEAEKALAISLQTFGLKSTGKRTVPTHEEKLGDEAKADELQLTHYVIETPPTTEQETQAFDRQLALAHLNFEFTTQKNPAGKRAHVCSASRNHVIYKTKGKEKYIRRIYPELENITAYMAAGHARFATNTSTLIENVQPLFLAMFNGEVNNLSRFISEIKYHPRFGQLIGVDFTEIDLTRYSDSVIMTLYIRMLELSGYNAEQIHDAIFHPYDPTKTNPVSEFHDLTGMPGLEGPNGSIRVYGKKVYVETDAMGWRPHRGILDKKRRILGTGSELGIFPDLEGEVIELDAGEAFVACAETGTVKLVKNQPETEQFFARHLNNISKLPSHPVSENPAILFSLSELQERKLRAGITSEIENTILKPMFHHGKGLTVSMGDDGGDEVTVSGPVRFINTQKTDFAQLTCPPLDYLREGEVMSGSTYVGRRALPEELYSTPWSGIRLDNPILDNEEMSHLLHSDKVKTKTIDCVYPVYGRDAAMHEALSNIVRQCKLAVQEGATLIVLSDLKSDSLHAPLLPSLLAGIVDLELKKAGVRHQVTLCLQSSMCVTPLEQIAALSTGANLINPYLVFAPDELYKTDKTAFIQERQSYKQTALKEILAAAARAGIRTLGSGFQGGRRVSALGLDTDVANSMGIHSELGGIDWANIAAMTIDMHTRPRNVGKYQTEGRRAGERKWNPGLVGLWRSIAKGEKTLREVLPHLLENIASAEKDNIEGWFKKKPPRIWTPDNPMTIIIVGGGAAGFMQAQALLNSPMGEKIKIKIIEENPANLFGAVKHGLAPDKAATKKAQYQLLGECLHDKRVEYYGGITVGKEGDVSFEALQNDYPVVIDCRGAPRDKTSTIKQGHDHMIPASKVWKAYNGYFDPFNPDRYWPFKNHSRSQVKIVIGNGNVAADIIRLLLTPPDLLDNTEVHPVFLDRLHKQGPSLVHNIARGSVTQCKMSLKELESLEENGILVCAEFNENRINESELTDEQIKKLHFFRRARERSPDMCADKPCVYFHFGCTPEKVVEAGRNILEIEVIKENGEKMQLRGGDIISAIGTEAAKEEFNTSFIAGWASGNGGNLTIINQSVEKTTQNILDQDKQGGFNHTKNPAPEQPWQKKASVSNQEFLNTLAYWNRGNPIDTVDDLRKARNYSSETPSAALAQEEDPDIFANITATDPSALTVIDSKTRQITSIPVEKSTSASVYRFLLDKSKEHNAPTPENECGEEGTCMRCVAKSKEPVPQTATEKQKLKSIYRTNASLYFLTCQHSVKEVEPHQPVAIVYPEGNRRTRH